MKLSELDYNFPEDLIATKPSRPSRVMWVEDRKPMELSIPELMEKFHKGDVLIINETKVSKRRLFGETSKDIFEVLFIKKIEDHKWEVLFPSSRLKMEKTISLPGGVQISLLESGLPQIVTSNKILDEGYFQKYGEIPLPPYIQKQRGDRHNLKEDEYWYQTAWAKEIGSQAAPTASLHFTNENLEELKSKGVYVEKIILHVGLGTFLPIREENLEKHKMHSEEIIVPHEVFQRALHQKKEGHRVWCLGTTVTRAMESCAIGKVHKNQNGDFEGFTDLFIKEGFDFKIADILLTNFHQPKTTLLALVSAFSSLETLKKCYSWAIERKFKLFSYGDLSVWVNEKKRAF